MVFYLVWKILYNIVIIFLDIMMSLFKDTKYNKNIFLILTIMIVISSIQIKDVKGDPADNEDRIINRIESENYLTNKNQDQTIHLKVENLLKEMTVEEKIREMYGFENKINAYMPMYLPIIKQRYSNYRLKIPAFAGTNGPGGVYIYGTKFPVALARASSWDPDLEYSINLAIGKEARNSGINLFFSPTLNIIRHPSWGRSQEGYGEDSYHIGIMGASAIKGLQKNVMSQAKHFACYNIEENRFTNNIQIDERTLREIYLSHFKKAVQIGNVSSIMTAYNRVNNKNMSENKHIIKDILKDGWSFEGFVASDWFAYGNTIESVYSGLDIQMPIPTYYGNALLEEIKKGNIPESIVNESVKRILEKKFEFNLFDNNPKFNLLDLLKNRKKNRELSLKSAQKSIVLLKNENNILPINCTDVRSIAVVGKYADRIRLGDFSCEFGFNFNPISPLKAIKKRADKIHINSYNGRSEQIARLKAKSADLTIVFAGTDIKDEGENLKILGYPFGGDRKKLSLPDHDIELIKSVSEVNDKVVVVLQAGGAISMGSWIDDVEGILMAWYPGIEGGNAIADILFGDVNPSAKIPITFPKNIDQLYPFKSDDQEIEFNYYHGYRYFDKNNLEPLFPFGYGLSYTDYLYNDINLNRTCIGKNDTIQISFNITNIGNIAGEEIAQLYIGYTNSSVDRALRDLKGFKKVCLQPDETKTVNLDLSSSDLAYYDVNRSSWVVEPITYIVEVGDSSRSLPLKTEFKFTEH